MDGNEGSTRLSSDRPSANTLVLRKHVRVSVCLAPTLSKPKLQLESFSLAELHCHDAAVNSYCPNGALKLYFLLKSLAKGLLEYGRRRE